MKISVVIPFRGQWFMTRDCLYSLYAGNETSEIETVLVHDGDIVVKDGGDINGIASVVMEEHGGPAEGGSLYRLWNAGIGVTSGEYVGVVNNDVFFSRGWDRVVSEELRRGEKIVCPLWSYPPGMQREVREGWAVKVGEAVMPPAGAGMIAQFGFIVRERCLLPVYQRNGMAGFCFFGHRRVFERVGAFDEGYHLWYGDTDWEQRAVKMGISVVVPRGFYVWHIQEASYGDERVWDMIKKDEERWRALNGESG